MAIYFNEDGIQVSFNTSPKEWQRHLELLQRELGLAQPKTVHCDGESGVYNFNFNVCQEFPGSLKLTMQYEEHSWRMYDIGDYFRIEKSLPLRILSENGRTTLTISNKFLDIMQEMLSSNKENLDPMDVAKEFRKITN